MIFWKIYVIFNVPSLIADNDTLIVIYLKLWNNTILGELDPCADMDYFNFTSAKRIKTYYNYDVNKTER